MRFKNGIFKIIILIVFAIHNINEKTEVITNKINIIYFIIFRLMII